MTNATYLPITADNAASFMGATVRFQWGPTMDGENYEVVRIKTTRWGTELIAVNEQGAEKTISGLSTVGIGCHLITAKV